MLAAYAAPDTAPDTAYSVDAVDAVAAAGVSQTDFVAYCLLCSSIFPKGQVCP